MSNKARKSAEILDGILWGTEKKAVKGIRWLGKQGYVAVALDTYLLEFVESNNELIQLEAIKALENAEFYADVDAVIRKFMDLWGDKHQDVSVRNAALSAAIRIEQKPIVEEDERWVLNYLFEDNLLRDTLVDDHDSILETASSLIREYISTETLVEYFKEYVQMEPLNRNGTIAFAIQTLRLKEAIPLLKPLLESTDWLVQYEALHCIRHIGDESHLPIIETYRQGDWGNMVVREANLAYDAILEKSTKKG